MAETQYRLDLEDEEFDENMDLGVQADYDGTYDQADSEAYAQQQRVAEAAALQAQALEALAAVPEPVKKYIIHLHALLNAPNPSLPEIQAAYEQGWNRLTEKFFQKSEWPEAEIIAPLVNHDEVFLTLYRELYFKHVYARLQPDLDDRFHSYENYCTLFNLILNSPGPVPLSLPIDWLYNIIDEFVYQYTSFVLWRSKATGKSEEEKLVLAESGHIWSCYSVLNVLYSLIQKSKIQDQLRAAQKGEDVEAAGGEYGVISLYHHLGYFSILGLLRVHVLLGDYTLALGMLDGIDLNKKALFTRVTGAHVAVYYYVGFSYMMLGRYPDAIRSFSHILFFILRLKHFQRGSQFDQINKTADRMYALLAICQALCPTKVDEGISTAMKEKFGEAYGKMIRGGPDSIASFQEMFIHGAPRFISPNPPPYELESEDALAAYSALPEPSTHQLSLFLAGVEPQLSTSNLRSFLRLYTTLGTDKLAGFLGVDEEEVLEMLMAAKGGARKFTWIQGSLLEGEVVGVSDINFGVDETHVTVAESKTSRKYGDFFLRHGLKFRDVYDNLRAKPLPIPKNRASNGVPAVVAAGAAVPAAPAPSSESKMLRLTRSIRLSPAFRHLSTEAIASATHKNPSDVVITYAKRSALTKAKKGGFKDTASDSLLYLMLKAALPEMKIDPAAVEDILVGTCHPPSPCYEARAATLAAGFPESTAVQALNRLCGSGLMAVRGISDSIARGDIEVGLAVGYESMSSHARPTPVFHHPDIIANGPSNDCAAPMGWTSEMLAVDYDVSREKQDEYGLSSHNRAEAAQKSGIFDKEILPLTTEVKDKETGDVSTVTVSKDDGIRYGSTIESMRKGRSAFPDWGEARSTGANSSQLTDGAAVALMMRRSKAEELGLTPIAKHIGTAVVGVSPRVMGIGPAVAIPALLKKHNLVADDIDLFEINEAFGSMYAYCVETLGLDPAKVNKNGGGIAMGHPLGATGVRQIVTGLNALDGEKGKLLVTSMCIGSGQGASALFVSE
ncbi:eukaryotic translation initiation factor 3 subunit L [Pseudohyphozyma bogoriensis]|nr:eukaryotic translation initiation factor 3 subunit L [Pseudohyphozyma bogoriensis]